MRPLCVSALLLLAIGCPRSHVVDAAPRDGGPRDGGPPRIDVGVADAFHPAVDGGDPFVCRGELGHGVFFGSVDGAPIELSYVVAGIDYGFCNTLFVRAGDTPTFDRHVLQIEVGLRDEPFPYEGSGGHALLFDPARPEAPTLLPVRVRVERVDGVFGDPTPEAEWRARATISIEHGGIELEGIVSDAPYCNDFPRCLI